MALFPEQYPVDLTAKTSRNLITNEVRTFTSHEERIFIPSGGPLYTETLVITDFATGNPLEPITQYSCLHLHKEATLDSGKQVCCIIIVKDTSVAKIKINYQVPGGKYGQVVTTLRDLLASADWDKIGRISWGSQIYGKPEVFPAAAHKHPGGEFGDWKRFHMALNNIYQAMINKDHGAWQSVYEYMARSIEVAFENNVLDSSQYYNRFQIDNLLNDLDIPMPDIPDQLPPDISKASGNLITAKPDGLYYGNLLNVKTVTASYTPTTADLTGNVLLRVNTTALSSSITIAKVAATVPIGSAIHITQMNAAVIIQPASGVAILPVYNLNMLRKGSTATLVYLGADQWDIIVPNPKDIEDNTDRILELESFKQSHTTSTNPHTGYVLVSEYNTKIADILESIRNLGASGIGGQVLASVTYKISSTGSRWPDIPTKPSETSGWAFGDFNPKVWKDTPTTSTPQGSRTGNFIVNLPAEFDPAKHRVEVPGNSSYTISGKTITIVLRYDQQSGTQRGSGGDTWSIYWLELNAVVRINIINKAGSGGGGVIPGGGSSGQFRASLNLSVLTEGGALTLGFVDKEGWEFLGYPTTLPSLNQTLGSFLTYYVPIRLPTEYDPALHRVQVAGYTNVKIDKVAKTVTVGVTAQPVYLGMSNLYGYYFSSFIKVEILNK